MTDAQLKTFLDSFTHNDSGDVKRNKFVLFGKKGTEDKFVALGYKQESAAISNNYDTSDMTDVLGVKYNDINDKNETIEMSEYHINKDKSAFRDTAFTYTLAGLESELNDYTLLMVCGWLTNEDGAMLARQVENCTLSLDNLGGQSFTMADVTFSGIGRGTFGTVTSLTDPTFTEYTPA